jgi:hypothetical protein
MRAHITEALLKGLQPTDRDQFVFDTKLSGFGYPAGTGIYFIGKPRRNFAVRGSLSPADARELARQMLTDLASGKDPIAERRARQQAITAGALTVAQLADRWMADYVRPKLKPRTIAEGCWQSKFCLCSAI